MKMPIKDLEGLTMSYGSFEGVSHISSGDMLIKSCTGLSLILMKEDMQKKNIFLMNDDVAHTCVRSLQMESQRRQHSAISRLAKCLNLMAEQVHADAIDKVDQKHSSSNLNLCIMAAS